MNLKVNWCNTKNETLLTCINDGVLASSGIKPKLKKGETYQTRNSCECGCGQLHYDVGLRSTHNYITCYKCGADLPNSGVGGIHWANSERFITC
jgi:hypothetical protein